MAKKGGQGADSERRKLKEKEKKRNKEQRDKAKQAQNAKRGTAGLEGEIRTLADQEAAGTLSASDKSQLESLRADLEAVKKAKAAQAAAKPPPSEKDVNDKIINVAGPSASSGKKFLKGKDPRRSVYYDPVFNPYGVPPPGMPYRERSPSPTNTKGKARGSDDEESDEDEDIVMPSESKLDTDESELDEDLRDIVMPEGPAPAKRIHGQPLIQRPTIAPPMPQLYMPTFPQRPLTHQIPPPPPGPPPIGFPSYPQAIPAHSYSAQPVYSSQPISFPAQQPHPSLFPTVGLGLAHQPDQPPPPAKLGAAQTTFSASAQIRDLKAEAMAFVPNALKRKRPPGVGSAHGPSQGLNEINSTGQSLTENEDDAATQERKSLLDGLVLGNGKKSRVEDVEDD